MNLNTPILYVLMIIIVIGVFDLIIMTFKICKAVIVVARFGFHVVSEFWCDNDTSDFFAEKYKLTCFAFIDAYEFIAELYKLILFMFIDVCECIIEMCLEFPNFIYNCFTSLRNFARRHRHSKQGNEITVTIRTNAKREEGVKYPFLDPCVIDVDRICTDSGGYTSQTDIDGDSTTLCRTPHAVGTRFHIEIARLKDPPDFSVME